ncbi:MAG: mobile mystery protein A [Dysgonamonadaceae bacterium]|jgi:predicted DNA-binding mobile mystery protein A|nr:mobile mystery protein A [Dysgonamonadaceae bacterium]
MKTDKLVRLQLDKQLNSIKCALNLTRPVYGWIKTLRNALGMTSHQFAKKMGVTQARVSAIEKGEIEDSLTLNTMKEAAAALNCRFIYFLLPEKNLEETVKNQAVRFAKRNTESLSHSMNLENQGIMSEDLDDFIEIQTEEILRKNSNKIWDIE